MFNKFGSGGLYDPLKAKKDASENTLWNRI